MTDDRSEGEKDPVEAEWQEQWAPILQRPDGTIDIDQLKKELYDFSRLITNSSQVYCYVTGGLISKPLTPANAVCGAHDDHVNDLVEEALKDATNDR